jgi:hypothetical protein
VVDAIQLVEQLGLDERMRALRVAVALAEDVVRVGVDEDGAVRLLEAL